MNAAELLGRYDAMWRITQQMLESAKLGDWDRLVELEHGRSAIVEVLMAQESQASWDAVEQAKKGRLIRGILDADAEIKALTASWMGELREILGSIGTEKKLHKAYETP